MASNEVLRKYQDILKANGILHPIADVDLFTPDSLKGAGMTSDMYYVTVNFKDPEVKPLHLFSKQRSPNPARDEMMDSMKLYEKEARFFMDYLPLADELCSSKGKRELMDIYPKCYHADERMIVFENLVKEKGYILLRKQERQGLESARIALKSLAKHHAISYALINEYKGPQSFFAKLPNLDFEGWDCDFTRNFLGPLIKNGISTNVKILEKSEVEGKEEAISILKAHHDKGFELIWEVLQYRPENEKILTLNHGDFWNNNMMFLKDETTQRLTGDFKMIDLQSTRYNSPALDVGNFMYTSMKPDVRRQHLEELLKTYLDTLITTSKDLGCPINLTYEEFFNLHRRKFRYGFWFSIWLAAEAGYAIINNVNAEDPDEFAKEFDRLVQEWIDDNPEKSEETAKDLVELMKEYSRLVIDA